MIKHRIIALFFITSYAQAADVPLMRWDDPQSATGLHVHFQGHDRQDKIWTVREARSEEFEFYQNLLGNPVITKNLANGSPLSSKHTAIGLAKWSESFAEGIPTSRMTIIQNDTPVGCVHLYQHPKPGVGELMRALQPSSQGNGLGTAVLGFVVNTWAPAVRQMGLGSGANTSPAAMSKFKCFNGAELRLLYTTARPSNQASWQSYKHFNFHPSQPTDMTIQISCVTWERSQQGDLEEYIVDKHFSPTASSPLLKNVLYGMLDENEIPRTLSFVEKYGSLRYHFEREVDTII